MSITKKRDTPTVTPIIILALNVSLSLGSLDGSDVEEGLTVLEFVLSDWLVGIEPVIILQDHKFFISYLSVTMTCCSKRNLF